MVKAKATAIKGDEAENIVLAYLKQQNRPYNSTDISLNLNGQVTKPNTQKALLSLTEKDLILKKEYGKITVFCIKQEDKEIMGVEELSALEVEAKSKKEALLTLKLERKRYQAELDGLSNTPMNQDLDLHMYKARSDADEAREALSTLQSGGTQLVSKAEMAQLDKSNIFWCKKWVERRSTFKDLWDQVTGSMDKEARSDLEENLGIETSLDLENEKNYKALMVK